MLVVVVALKITVLPEGIKKGGKIDVLGEQLAVSSVSVEPEMLVIWYSTVATEEAAVIVSFAVSMSASVSAFKQPTSAMPNTDTIDAVAMRMSDLLTGSDYMSRRQLAN
jgi:hypothetical protein